MKIDYIVYKILTGYNLLGKYIPEADSIDIQDEKIDKYLINEIRQKILKREIISVQVPELAKRYSKTEKEILDLADIIMLEWILDGDEQIKNKIKEDISDLFSLPDSQSNLPNAVKEEVDEETESKKKEYENLLIEIEKSKIELVQIQNAISMYNRQVLITESGGHSKGKKQDFKENSTDSLPDEDPDSVPDSKVREYIKEKVNINSDKEGTGGKKNPVDNEDIGEKHIERQKIKNSSVSQEYIKEYSDRDYETIEKSKEEKIEINPAEQHFTPDNELIKIDFQLF